MAALVAVCAAVGAPAPPAAAQASSDRQNDRLSRRYYTQPVTAEPAVETGAVARTYRKALSRLAAGASAEAEAVVGALDPHSALEAVGARRTTVRDVARVLEEVAAHDPEALLPAILLHVELFRRSREARDFAAVNHHAAVIAHIAPMYAARAGTPEARAAAAQVLAAVGLPLLEDQRWTPALDALRRALDLEPAHDGALLGLALEREFRDVYPEAIDLLERYVAAHPESAEGRLRLAVNLQRTGRRRDAADLFTALTREPAAAWTTEIAYQELARNRVDEGDPAGAAALLREAIARFPGSERLRLQLAYALDRAGDPAAAREAIAELAKSPPDGAGESARRRYTRFPDSAAALSLTAVRASADLRLGTLAAALERLAAEADGG